MKNRRGLSSILGAVFFVIIFSSVLSYVTYDTDLLTDLSKAIIAKNQVDLDTYHEKFSITKVTLDNNKFNITVQNLGNIPINITNLWVQNKSDVTWGTAKYVINPGVVYPGHSLSNIGQNLAFTAKSSQGYDLKLVTTRGNTNEFFVNSASQEPVYLQLFALPASGGPNNFNTTLVFAVTNNMTNGGTLSNVQPSMLVTNTTGQAILISGPTPSVYPLLPNGDVALFKWQYKITGTNGQKVNFKPSLKNGYLDNFVSQDVTITNVTSGINIGHGGKGFYSGVSANNLRFKNATAGAGITITSNATDVIISSSGGSGGRSILSQTNTPGTSFTQTSVLSGDVLLVFAKGDITLPSINSQTISLNVVGVAQDQVTSKAGSGNVISFALNYQYSVPSSSNVPITVSTTGGTLNNVKIQVIQLR